MDRDVLGRYYWGGGGGVEVAMNYYVNELLSPHVVAYTKKSI